MADNKHRRGFTIIELTLVMAFFSILLLAILTLTLHIGKLYTKGMTNKSLNLVGRDVSDTLRRDFAAADPTHITNVIVGGPAGKTYGRLCLGGASYLWNTTGLLNASSPLLDVVTSSGSQKVKMARVVDPSGSYCVSGGAGYPMAIASTASWSDLLVGDDLDGARGFGLYDFTATKVADGLYRLRYTIGTYDSDTTESGGGGYTCKPPTEPTADFSYCSVADFDMYVRAGGEG